MSPVQNTRDPPLVGKAIRAQPEHEIPPDFPLERDFREGTEYTITDHVNSLHEKLVPDVRMRELITSLVSHLHAFARETSLTHEEWRRAIALLTRAGQESTPHVNEFVLLSDCMGLSALVDELEHPKPTGCTESCEAGPFFTDDAPELPTGSFLASSDTVGELMFFQATVKNTKGEGIPGVKADVWQADGDGLYDVQYPNRNDGVPNDRGRIVAQANGEFRYRGVLPVAYSIPNDGPTGDVLRTLGRHAHRSSHLHFMISSPGYDTYVPFYKPVTSISATLDSLTTALYPSFSPFLGTDPVFATKKSLICDVEEVVDKARWAEMGWKAGEVEKNGGRVWVWRYDFVLATDKEVADLKQRRE